VGHSAYLPQDGGDLISERVNAETASQQLGHSSPSITREFYISKPAIAADVAHVLEELARTEDD
jgi:integrase